MGNKLGIKLLGTNQFGEPITENIEVLKLNWLERVWQYLRWKFKREKVISRLVILAPAAGVNDEQMR